MEYSRPGKRFRAGLSLADLFRMFPDDAAAESGFVERRCPHGVRCPYCDCDNNPVREAWADPESDPFMGPVAVSVVGKRVHYRDLVAA